MRSRIALTPLVLASPLALVFLLFFLVPLLLIVVVSVWDYSEYELIPAFTLQNYHDVFRDCSDLSDPCLTFRTYWSTLRIASWVWLITLPVGFAVAYFLRFYVRDTSLQVALFLLCTIPFWTSNVIRSISWIPLLGRNGLVNDALQRVHLVDQPLDWLLFSEFSVVVAFVHLYTLFMIVPLFNSMTRINDAVIDAARDAGAGEWRTALFVVLPLCKPGIAIGSIFVVTVVIGDFITIGIMGGQQIASIGKVIQVEASYLQFPAAAANAVVLLGATLLAGYSLVRLVDLRKEL